MRYKYETIMTYFSCLFILLAYGLILTLVIGCMAMEVLALLLSLVIDCRAMEVLDLLLTFQFNSRLESFIAKFKTAELSSQKGRAHSVLSPLLLESCDPFDQSK